MKVSKIGRTTEETEGTVHGCIIQAWINNQITTEIAVIGDKKDFADVGDSGSLVVTAEDSYALGMLIGNNSLRNLAIVSPLWAVLEDVQAKLGRKVEFYTE
jgi:hypothetical protein